MLKLPSTIPPHAPSANYNDALQHLLTAANIYAPTAKEQRGFANIVAAMQRDGHSPSDIGAQIVCALFDGIAYGNWPKL